MMKMGIKKFITYLYNKFCLKDTEFSTEFSNNCRDYIDNNTDMYTIFSKLIISIINTYTNNLSVKYNSQYSILINRSNTVSFKLNVDDIFDIEINFTYHKNTKTVFCIASIILYAANKTIHINNPHSLVNSFSSRNNIGFVYNIKYKKYKNDMLNLYKHINEFNTKTFVSFFDSFKETHNLNRSGNLDEFKTMIENGDI